MKNGEFSQSVINTLSKRAGSHCTICKKITSIPHRDPEKFHNLGEAAHIVGQKDAPNLRFDGLFTPKQMSTAKNGIWLCQPCHHIIDNDAVTYTVEVLNQLKSEHDLLIRTLHESGSKLMPTLESKLLETEALKLLIRSKEQLLTEQQALYSEEINALKFNLGLLQSETGFLKDQLKTIKAEIIDLNSPEIIEAMLEGGNLEKALDLLDEETLNKSEVAIGRARLIKARLLLSRGDFANAKHNFQRALEIWPSYYVAHEYIKVLYYHSLDYLSVIKVAETVLHTEKHPRLQIELSGHLAQAFLKSGLYQQAFNTLINALEISKSLPEEEGTMHLVQKARLEKHLGDCCKGLSKLSQALTYYEMALNSYFQATIRHDEHTTTKEFAGLSTAIGLLYEQNNNEVEGLVHHLRAKDVIKNDKDSDNTRALIFLNIATCYLQRRTFDAEQARYHALSATKILNKLSKDKPTENLEYLVGAKCQLADIYKLLNPKYCKKYYEQALSLATTLYRINPVFIWELSHVKHNYAVYLIVGKKTFKEGLCLLDESIALMESQEPTDSRFIENMSKALLFKVQFIKENHQMISLLNRVIQINQNTDRENKCFIFKFAAQEMLNKIIG